MSPRPDTRRAFTLVEVALAMAIGAILLLALGGSLMLTTSAADTGNDSAAKALQASSGLAQLSADLAVATAIPTFSANDMLMSVPDRDGDAVQEKIEYTWSGHAGDPLMRSYNGSTPTAVIPALQSAALSTVSRPPASPVESAEAVLMSCDTVAGSSSANASIDKNGGSAGQYIRPTFPAGATAWKITRASVFLTKTTGSSKPFRVSIRTADAALKPTSTILASALGSGSAASSSGAWMEFALPVSGLSPTQGICIVIESFPDGECSAAYLQNGSAQPFNTHFMSSTNFGSTWSTPIDTKDLRFILSGTYTKMVEP